MKKNVSLFLIAGLLRTTARRVFSQSVDKAADFSVSKELLLYHGA